MAVPVDDKRWEDAYELATELRFPDGIGEKDDGRYWLNADTQTIYVTYRGNKFIVSVEPQEDKD